MDERSTIPALNIYTHIADLERVNLELQMEVNRLRAQLSHTQDLAPVRVYEAAYSTRRPADHLAPDEGQAQLWAQVWQEGLQPQLAGGALLLMQWFGFRTIPAPAREPWQPTQIRARFAAVPLTITRPDYENLFRQW